MNLRNQITLRYKALFYTSLFLIFFALYPLATYCQGIRIDESFDDWGSYGVLYEDGGDNSNFDIRAAQFWNDDRFLYFRLELDRDINLQENNQLQLLLDLDNNAQTGELINGMGVDMQYSFGNRIGTLANGAEFYHNDVGLVSAPTVSAAEFEISLSLEIIRGLHMISDTIGIAFRNKVPDGDVIPDDSVYRPYGLFRDSLEQAYPCMVSRANGADLRIMSYNVLRDNIFNPALSANYRRILKAVKADIMCFQEVYDRSAMELLMHLEELGTIESQESWYSAKDGRDLITVSKYPITGHIEVDGNSFVKIAGEQGEILIINCHLPCCDNDEDRVSEIDALLGFLGASLRGENSFPVEENTAIVITGDMNFVGDAFQVQQLLTGDIRSNFIYGPDIVMDYGDGRLTDAKPFTCGIPAVYTWYNNQSSFPPGRLDYLFYTDSVLKKEQCFVLNTRDMTEAELDTHSLLRNDSQLASDHLPLVVDFSVIPGTSSHQLYASKEEVRIYPNPNTGWVYADVSENFVSAHVYDSTGRKIQIAYEKEISRIRINLSELNSGMYLITLESRNNIQTARFILE